MFLKQEGYRVRCLLRLSLDSLLSGSPADCVESPRVCSQWDWNFRGLERVLPLHAVCVESCGKHTLSESGYILAGGDISVRGRDDEETRAGKGSCGSKEESDLDKRADLRRDG